MSLRLKACQSIEKCNTRDSNPRPPVQESDPQPARPKSHFIPFLTGSVQPSPCPELEYSYKVRPLPGSNSLPCPKPHKHTEFHHLVPFSYLVPTKPPRPPLSPPSVQLDPKVLLRKFRPINPLPQSENKVLKVLHPRSKCPIDFKDPVQLVYALL